MTFNGAEDNYGETNIKRSFIIWFNILRSRETKLHWFILSSLNVYDSLQSRGFLTETQRQSLSQGWLRGTLITSPFKSVLIRPNTLAVLTTKIAAGYSVIPKKNMDRAAKYAYFVGYVYDRLP